MATAEALAGVRGETSLRDAPVIELDRFGKRYRRKRAAQDVSLRVARSELYGLIGPDGAGKSSLMKAVAGVLSYEAGTVRVFGQLIDSERAAEAVKARLGFMPQGLGLNLYPELSVEENVDFFASLRLVPSAEATPRKEQLLAMTRLAPFRARPMKNLSGGMKQKLGLVCTLIHAPELIILDEPTTGVDPVSRREFWIILAQLIQSQRLTALVSTAYLDEASRFDRLALMHDGHVLTQGDPDRLMREYGARIVEIHAEAGQINLLAQRFPQIDLRGETARIYVEQDDDGAAQRAVQDVLPDAVASRVTVRPPELEDVFVALLRTRERLALDPVQAFSAAAPQHGEDEHAIHAHELTRDFGAFRAVDCASFGVHYGEIFGLLGANGAGKTTVIKMLTGILPPSAGSGRVAGADMRRAGQAIKERVGYMSQAFSLYTELTVMENLLLFAGVYGLERRVARERARWVIELGALEGHEDAAAGSLPMGLRQRLALGCALIHRPRVLFLDEPTSGVDPIGRRRFWKILRQLAREQGVAILLTTHYMSEAELCDRLALMFAGRVVADATPAAMKAQLTEAQGQLLEVSAERPVAALDAIRAADFSDAVLHGRAIHVMARDPGDAQQRIRAALDRAGLPAPQIAPQAITMEDVFVHRVLALEAAAAAQRT
ncbi:MAG TPA: ATP-binding cassette domain-containing protein [Burkholderiales bacterium]|nr:ATP-binding cassette domain-containing protein [Burkholderiales bacterium]